ncbi:hypothetical protein ABID82_005112 [Methylobacterium sp. PvP062]|uniref:Uncharacterized protein n=1 Tax=Methylobacterium radiotolerans TaxID=31998 RepID=A0ABV2NUS9_9HYPH|nr:MULTISPECIES: hypothetical protein [unclassified Methylobacterium]MBP2498426.1 hypothetical protein [Methylobacterium sp. PvP105]MBP2505605.1 hypothetical protein [Methylobacterium sp. PvP109]
MIDRSGKDCMGYPLEQQLDGFTDEDIGAARVLARNANFQWDCVLEDPKVTGRRFLEQARTVRETLESLGWRRP